MYEIIKGLKELLKYLYEKKKEDESLVIVIAMIEKSILDLVDHKEGRKVWRVIF